MLTLAVIIFRDREGNILVQFRDGEAPTNALEFSLFGGLAHDDETLEEAVIREVKEELDIDLAPSDLILLAKAPWTGKSGEKIVYFYECKRTLSWSDVNVLEGAGAAFLSKKDIEQMDCISDFARHFICTYAQ